jgi:hypothetical protein
MAITCNGFTENTVGATQQLVSCMGPKTANLANDEMQPEQFLFLVIDSLNRLAEGDGIPVPLDGLTQCDISETLRLANCATHQTLPPYNVTNAQLQAIILTMLNEGLCAI